MKKFTVILMAVFIGIMNVSTCYAIRNIQDYVLTSKTEIQKVGDTHNIITNIELKDGRKMSVGAKPLGYSEFPDGMLVSDFEITNYGDTALSGVKMDCLQIDKQGLLLHRHFVLKELLYEPNTTVIIPRLAVGYKHENMVGIQCSITNFEFVK